MMLIKRPATRTPLRTHCPSSTRAAPSYCSAAYPYGGPHQGPRQCRWPTRRSSAWSTRSRSRSLRCG
jgi:hypothetical protein